MSDLVSEGEAMPVQLDHRPDSLTFSVYNAIRQAIIDGRIPPATRVTEAALAKQLDVSKTPVREALLRLKEIGLIESDGPLSGRIVTASRQRAQDAYEIREALETTSARLAAQRGDRATLQAAERHAKASVTAADERDIAVYRTADEAFHAAIAQASGNRKLARMIDDVNALISALRQRVIPEVDASPTCASQHVAVVEAVLGGDARTAERLMRQHVRHVSSEVLKAFAE
jgi:DNA-binding GntR family transcriptional regulator